MGLIITNNNNNNNITTTTITIQEQQQSQRVVMRIKYNNKYKDLSPVFGIWQVMQRKC